MRSIRLEVASHVVDPGERADSCYRKPVPTFHNGHRHFRKAIAMLSAARACLASSFVFQDETGSSRSGGETSSR